MIIKLNINGENYRGTSINSYIYNKMYYYSHFFFFTIDLKITALMSPMR